MTNQFRAAARLIVVNNKNEVLIVRMNNHWAIPWWWIDHGEKVNDCLMRESFEELWVKAKFDKVLFIQDYLWDVKWEQKHCLEYFCSIKNNADFLNVETEYKKASHSFELKEVKFCKLEDFPSNFMPKALPEILNKYILNKDNFSCEYISWL